MNPRKLIIALIIGVAFIAWINMEFNRRDSQMSSQNKYMSDIQKELKKYKDKTKQGSKDYDNKVTVVYDYAVAAIDIKKGDIIEVEQVNLKQYKKKQTGAFEDVTKILGKLTFKDIKAGELIKTSYIGEDNTYKIPNGMRAVNVPISKIEGFNSLVHKSKRIDIVTATKNSEIILENIMVVAINKHPARKVVESITLEIPAYASADLVKAINSGKIHFVIRGKNDTKRVTRPKKRISHATQPVETKKLPNLPKDSTPMPEVDTSSYTTTLILGSEKSEVKFN